MHRKLCFSVFAISLSFLNIPTFIATAMAASDEAIISVPKGTINVINENFKDLIVAFTGQGKTLDGKPPITYNQKIDAGEERKFKVEYLGGAQFYSITGVLADGVIVPFTESTCTNLNVNQHYKVTFTKVDDVVTQCKAELLDEAGQVVK
ncbi:hypothetical protein [Candidatus Paracaedibacter symbiosus]|uniref:hypothetical protein n=1 Tax=Candidatus Paracaedibacter symbiosus TaxID=244582 RepID=UPI000509C4AD|nr:hypothetical protein [Candidatus Paracaedibacter symbiosus]